MAGLAVTVVRVGLAQARARRVSVELAAMVVMGRMARWASPVWRAVLPSVTAAMGVLAAMVVTAAMRASAALDRRQVLMA
jgi:hypothetical protein